MQTPLNAKSIEKNIEDIPCGDDTVDEFLVIDMYPSTNDDELLLYFALPSLSNYVN